MTKNILSPEQKTFLELAAKNSPFNQTFYLTGGTALNEFYLPYRYSEDLDFFSEKEINLNSTIALLRSLKEGLGYREFEFNTSFNRNLLFLHFERRVLKLEFTYFPFPQLEKPKVIKGLKVDSLLDISVNKLFTIYQNPRSRDFIDLFMINQKFAYSVEFLIKKAKFKFDWHVDPLKLGAQFLQAKELKDYPRLIKPLDHREWKNFFEEEAKRLKKKIFQD